MPSEKIADSVGMLPVETRCDFERSPDGLLIVRDDPTLFGRIEGTTYREREGR